MADSRYVLMHKNTPVADLQLDTDTGVIRSVGHVYNALHVPVGIPVKRESLTGAPSIHGGPAGPFQPAVTAFGMPCESWSWPPHNCSWTNAWG